MEDQRAEDAIKTLLKFFHTCCELLIITSHSKNYSKNLDIMTRRHCPAEKERGHRGRTRDSRRSTGFAILVVVHGSRFWPPPVSRAVRVRCAVHGADIPGPQMPKLSVGRWASARGLAWVWKRGMLKRSTEIHNTARSRAMLGINLNTNRII
jgi:hypothetical protein